MAKEEDEVEKLSKEEQKELSAKISSRIIDVINEELIPLHHAGKLGAGSMIFLGTCGLAMSTATLMFDQVPEESNNPEIIEKLIQSHDRIFRQCAKTILSGEEKEEKSTWDKGN